MRPTSDFPEEQRAYIDETKDHIRLVDHWLTMAIDDLTDRRTRHDASKLEDPELSGFMAMTADARLKDLTYGSDEYRAVLREHTPTIQHHYAANDHHPEHFENGLYGMSLMGILEMLCDWKASTGRMKDGDLRRSIESNAVRFGYSERFARILLNTAEELGMLDD